MSLLKVELLTREPSLFETDARFMAVGKMRARGDEFVVFIGLESGKTYIEEAFKTEALGHFIVGLKQVDDDTLWQMLVEAGQKYGLTASRHIGDCIKKLSLRISMLAARIIAPLPDDLEYIKRLGIIK
jgi:hypothetical protein